VQAQSYSYIITWNYLSFGTERTNSQVRWCNFTEFPDLLTPWPNTIDALPALVCTLQSLAVEVCCFAHWFISNSVSDS